MNKIIISFLILVFATCFVEGQVKQRSVKDKDLKDPASPSYVPKPYPKNEKDIITDLKYALDLHYGADVISVQTSGKSLKRRRVEASNNLLARFAASKTTDLKVGTIHKINHSTDRKTKDYYYIIDLVDSEGNIGFRVSMDATGLFSGLISGDDSPLYSLSDDKIINSVNELFKKSSKKVKIKSVRKVFMPYQNNTMVKFDNYNSLLRVITLNNGEIYYACSGRVYGSKEHTHYMALYKMYDKHVVGTTKSKHDLYKNLLPMKSKTDVRIDNTLKGEFMYLQKVGDMFKYNSHVKNKRLVYQRNVK